MTNNKKTNKSKRWLKVALISTAGLSTLAAAPIAICATNANSKSNKEVKSSLKRSTPVLSTGLEAASYKKVTFNLRATDIAEGAKITGQTITKIKANGRFGSIEHPKVRKEGWKFEGWSKDETTQETETYVTNETPITEDTTVYAVFSKMVVYFPECTDTESPYQWTYEGAENAEKKIVVPFRMGDKFKNITPPTPKWKTPASGTTKVWDGKWYDKPQTDETRVEIGPDADLKKDYQTKEIFPGWKDVDVDNISVEGRTTVSITEVNITYTAKVYPKQETPDNVDWYVCDNPVEHADEGSTIAQVVEGKINCTTTEPEGDFYVFALAKGSAVPKTIDTTKKNILKVHVTTPDKDPIYAGKIIIKSGSNYYAADPKQFYPDYGTDEIEGKKLGVEESTGFGTQSEFNSEIILGDKITNIDDDFLSGFAALNKDVVLSDGIGYIGDNFFLDGTAFNASIHMPKNLFFIGDSFLEGCAAFNTKLDLTQCEHLTHIGNYFMSGCKDYDKIFTVPASLVKVGEGFMFDCVASTEVAINCDIEAFKPSQDSFAIASTDPTEEHKVTIVINHEDSRFSDFHTTFNDEHPSSEKGKELSVSRQLIGFDWSKTKLGDDKQAIMKNSDGTFSLVASIANSGLASEDGTGDIHCFALDEAETPQTITRNNFNSKVYLNPNLDNLAIPSGFLYGCPAFINEGQPLEIPANTVSIGQHFLDGCSIFNQDVILPSSLTTANSIGGYFMANCNSMTSTIEINGSVGAFTVQDNSFATTTADQPCTTQGIKIGGLSEADWNTFHNTFKDTTESPFRKLVKAGAPVVTPGWHNVPTQLTWMIDQGQYDTEELNIDENPIFYVKEGGQERLDVSSMTITFSFTPTVAAFTPLVRTTNISKIPVGASTSDFTIAIQAAAIEVDGGPESGHYLRELVGGTLKITLQDSSLNESYPLPDINITFQQR